MAKTKLPENFRQFFWDVNFDDLYLEDAPTLVLKRVLDRGYTNDIKWILKRFTLDDIKKLLLATRDLDPKTGKFWADVLSLDYSRVPCLQKPYSPIHWGLYS
jgi:hypothetical protein